MINKKIFKYFFMAMIMAMISLYNPSTATGESVEDLKRQIDALQKGSMSLSRPKAGRHRMIPGVFSAVTGPEHGTPLPKWSACSRK